uniref:Double PHD fingers 3 n=1 Tax=Sus scrofa TaxID=9823 RepID=A0A8D1RW31_PIG
DSRAEQTARVLGSDDLDSAWALAPTSCVTLTSHFIPLGFTFPSLGTRRLDRVVSKAPSSLEPLTFTLSLSTGLAPGQLYTYPARCWRKKRRLHPPEDPKLRLLEIKPEVELPLKKDGFTSESTTLEALLRGEGVEKKVDTREEESIQEIQRVLENDENVEEGNEEEDLEEDIPKRKNRTRGRARGSAGGRRRHDAASQEDHDKPYVCDICGKRYKNRPGLSYHYAHTHLASEEGDEAQDQETRSPPNHRNENHRPQKGPDGTVIPNNYCDFCLGGSNMNKKSGRPEELVSCADCGRSGECACRPGTVLLAFLCHLAGGGAERWGCRSDSGGILSGEGYPIILIFVFLRTKSYTLGSREKERRFWPVCVWPFHEVDISLCVVVDDRGTQWEHWRHSQHASLYRLMCT